MVRAARVGSGNHRVITHFIPTLGLTTDLLLSSTAVADNNSGTLAFNSGAVLPTYSNEKHKPGVVRYWMREVAKLVVKL